MNLLESLYNSYNSIGGIAGNKSDSEEKSLNPIFHSNQNAHITIVINKNGDFLRAEIVDKKNSKTMIPVTANSENRTTNISPHALCDKLQYVAADYNERCKKERGGFEKYFDLLSKWQNTDPTNIKLKAILNYVSKKSLIKDLVLYGTFVSGDIVDGTIIKNDNFTIFDVWQDSDGKSLIKDWENVQNIPEIFKINKTQSDCFIRWCVEDEDILNTDVWNDGDLQNSWINYCVNNSENEVGLCYITGKNVKLAESHPQKIRNSGDKAKIISSNDIQNFTYRGDIFYNNNQACGIGYEVSQKAHSMLRYLFEKQGYKYDTLAIVAWAIKNIDMPDLMSDTFDFSFNDSEKEQSNSYTAQEVGIALTKKISGYSAKIASTEKIMIVAIDGEQKGRISVNFYQELENTELWNNVLKWHKDGMWKQKFSKDKEFFGVPSPAIIAEVAYGTESNATVKKSVVAKLLPCIINGEIIPKDIVDLCVKNACKRSLTSYIESEKRLGVACSLYKLYAKSLLVSRASASIETNKTDEVKQEYKMTLESERKTRDYLFGRLLACYERLEDVYLFSNGQKRSTHAIKLMNQFMERPNSTLLQIHKNTLHCEDKLKTSRSGFLHNIKNEISLINSMFDFNDYVSDKRLTGEFLLGYYCQRETFKTTKVVEKEENIVEGDDETV